MDRTDTTKQTVFRLPEPNAATFDFSQLGTIHVYVPADSRWRMTLHWHLRHLGCESLFCVAGRAHVYEATGFMRSGDIFGGKGLSMQFQPGQHVSWGRDDWGKPDPRPLVVDLVTDDEVLHRNVCSAVLDHEHFPQLRTTPPWLRLLFMLLAWMWPAGRKRLLTFLLWVQLQTIFYDHDFYPYHGQIDVSWPWTARPFGGRPPKRVGDFRWKSQEVISTVVLTSCYWIGRLMLGMKGEYPQYTPAANAAAQEKEETIIGTST